MNNNQIKKIVMYDTKPYDKESFERAREKYPDYKIKYLESKMNPDTAKLAEGYDAAIAFVNDSITKDVLNTLFELKVGIIAMRCAGYNNVDFEQAYNKVRIVRVPSYSPHAVAEHTMALLLSLSRKIHRAYNRTRDFNFSLQGLTGFNLHGKTIGIIGTGQIGQIFASICEGFGMKVVAYDPYPKKDAPFSYVSLEELLQMSDIISLHCPLTEDTYHVLNEKSLSLTKDGVYIINTSRGALIESEALLHALRSGRVAGAGLDVYEEESELFFEDFSGTIIQDDILALLVSLPNVIVTSHQAFLTSEALGNIAQTTFENLQEYFDGKPLTNEVCYKCDDIALGSFCSATDSSCKFKAE